MHQPGKRFQFDKVEEEIRNQTDIIAGGNKGVSDAKITLKVYSNKVVQLTLVDLPGIVKVKSDSNCYSSYRS